MCSRGVSGVFDRLFISQVTTHSVNAELRWVSLLDRCHHHQKLCRDVCDIMLRQRPIREYMMTARRHLHHEDYHSTILCVSTVEEDKSAHNNLVDSIRERAQFDGQSTGNLVNAKKMAVAVAVWCMLTYGICMPSMKYLSIDEISDSLSKWKQSTHQPSKR